jgi:microcystin-dependent protein
MDPLLGSLLLVAFDFVPRGWLPCDGQILSIAQNTALFALLGVKYGGNGTTTFALPNLNGAKPMTDAGGAKLSWVICTEGVFPERM